MESSIREICIECNRVTDLSRNELCLDCCLKDSRNYCLGCDKYLYLTPDELCSECNIDVPKVQKIDNMWSVLYFWNLL